MNIRIHRGTHQIGGCVTEYEYEGWRLFVDYGEQLPGAPKTEKLQVEGLTYGDLSKSALLITHYHGDHIGRITDLPESLPMYIGKVARDIQLALSNHLKSVDARQDIMVERLNRAHLFEPAGKFSFGPFDIMPVTVDHSAFDAYAFKIEAGGVKVFHTGDFRTHGFRSGKLNKMLNKFVGDVDYLVCEATNARCYDKKTPTESDIQKDFETRFKENKFNVVYLSSTNIDRLFSLYHAALEAGRPFYVDGYQKRIMDIIAKKDSLWSKSNLYQYGQYEPKELLYDHCDHNEFKVNEKFEDFIDLKGYVLVARSNPRFDRFIERLPGEKRKYLSMWEGYVKEGDAYNESLARSLGDDYEYIHTSGHCDMASMREVFSLLHPKAIIPIHTDSPDAFAELFSDEWPIILLNDGETFSPISSSLADAVSADVLCVKALDEDIKIIDNTTGESAWGLEEKCIGKFKKLEDATFAISHTSYKTNATLGYEVDEEEDMSSSVVNVYDSGMTLLATYKRGGHKPGGKKYQEACRFASGEKVLAAFHAGCRSVVPVTVKGPVTPDHFREIYENDDLVQISYDTFEDFLNILWDWDWDSVAVHPHVKLESLGEGMDDTMLIPRVFLFPYREFKLVKSDIIKEQE